MTAPWLNSNISYVQSQNSGSHEAVRWTLKKCIMDWVPFFFISALGAAGTDDLECHQRWPLEGACSQRKAAVLLKQPLLLFAYVWWCSLCRSRFWDMLGPVSCSRASYLRFEWEWLKMHETVLAPLLVTYTNIQRWVTTSWSSWWEKTCITWDAKKAPPVIVIGYLHISTLLSGTGYSLLAASTTMSLRLTSAKTRLRRNSEAAEADVIAQDDMDSYGPDAFLFPACYKRFLTNIYSSNIVSCILYT